MPIEISIPKRRGKAKVKVSVKRAMAEAILEKVKNQEIDVNVALILGLSQKLCKSLNTTNCMESIMSQLGQYTDKVDRWHNSNQLLRWPAAGLIEIEPRLHKIRGYRYLNLLRMKLRDEILRWQEKEAVTDSTTDDLMQEYPIQRRVPVMPGILRIIDSADSIKPEIVFPQIIEPYNKQE